ncbi:MAG TPA: diacylglycerol kinase family lipid kinase [Verrucomicrobiota bacterium]|nr:diacylglycerol kinase family lipid kinase [Verrucomicrobiota bacterium]HNU49531.1 diacylglycerol kinase family lipid kinase [Verrucomicrobiota bacterium]
MSRSILYILNPAAAAGTAHDRWERWRAALSQRNLHGDVVATQTRGHAIDLAAAAANRFDILAAVGGDGLVGEIASGIIRARGRATLGILPLGTGNDVATQLGITTPETAFATLDRGAPKPLDAIEVRYRSTSQDQVRHALVFASVGFAGELLRQTTPRVKRWFGPRLCYPIGFVRALFRYRAPPMRIRTETATFEGAFLHVGAGNAEWAGGGTMRISPGARWDDGELDFCLVSAMNRLETAWHFPKLVRGTFATHPKVRYFRGQWLQIETASPIDLQLDGERLGCTPAAFRLLPAALGVLRPPAGADPVPAGADRGGCKGKT